jgi:hypothetical protein
MANGVSETPNDVLQLKDYNPVKGRARISGATQPMHLYYQVIEPYFSTPNLSCLSETSSKCHPWLLIRPLDNDLGGDIHSIAVLWAK